MCLIYHFCTRFEIYMFRSFLEKKKRFRFAPIALNDSLVSFLISGQRFMENLREHVLLFRKEHKNLF